MMKIYQFFQISATAVLSLGVLQTSLAIAQEVKQTQEQLPSLLPITPNARSYNLPVQAGQQNALVTQSVKITQARPAPSDASAGGDIYSYNAGSWTKIGGPGKTFVVGGGGQLYGTSPK